MRLPDDIRNRNRVSRDMQRKYACVIGWTPSTASCRYRDWVQNGILPATAAGRLPMQKVATFSRKGNMEAAVDGFSPKLRAETRPEGWMWKRPRPKAKTRTRRFGGEGRGQGRDGGRSCTRTQQASAGWQRRCASICLFMRDRHSRCKTSRRQNIGSETRYSLVLLQSRLAAKLRLTGSWKCAASFLLHSEGFAAGSAGEDAEA